MPESFGNDLELSIARSIPLEPGQILPFLCNHPELLDRHLCFLTHDVHPPGLDPIPALGVDDQGRLSILEWCGAGGDKPALLVLDHLEWLAENLALLRSLGIADQIRDLSREWRVFVVLSQPAPSLSKRLQWASEVSFEYFVAHGIQVEGRSSLWIEPWNTWRFKPPGGADENGSGLEELSNDALLSPQEREAILTSLRNPSPDD